MNCANQAHGREMMRTPLKNFWGVVHNSAIMALFATLAIFAGVITPTAATAQPSISFNDIETTATATTATANGLHNGEVDCDLTASGQLAKRPRNPSHPTAGDWVYRRRCAFSAYVWTYCGEKADNWTSKSSCEEGVHRLHSSNTRLDWENLRSPAPAPAPAPAPSPTPANHRLKWFWMWAIAATIGIALIVAAATLFPRNRQQPETPDNRRLPAPNDEDDKNEPPHEPAFPSPPTRVEDILVNAVIFNDDDEDKDDDEPEPDEDEEGINPPLPLDDDSDDDSDDEPEPSGGEDSEPDGDSDPVGDVLARLLPGDEPEPDGEPDDSDSDDDDGEPTS